MPRFLPIGKEAKGAAGFLLAALPALGALLTALAISGDLIGRMARNHPLASFGAFGSAAVAVFLGAIAAYGLQEGSREERGVLSVGILVLGAALVFGVYAGVETWGDRAQPSITVTPKSGSLVAVSVRGIGLRSSDHIVVEVEQLLRGADRQGRPTWQPGQPLYGASIGPNGSGEIEHTVSLSLPAGASTTSARARGWATSPALVTRTGTQPAASACTSPARRSGPNSPLSGRRLCEPRACWSGSGLATCLSAPRAQ